MKVEYFGVPSWSIELLATLNKEDLLSFVEMIQIYLSAGKICTHKYNSTVNYIAKKWMESIDRSEVYETQKKGWNNIPDKSKENTAKDTYELGKKVFEELKEEWQNKIKNTSN